MYNMDKILYHAHELNETVTIKKLCTLWYQEFTKNFEFAGESHDFWEIVYVDKGEIIATAEQTDIFLKQGEMLFHKPNEFHQLRSNGIVAPNVFVMTFVCHSPAICYFENKHIKIPPEHRWFISKIVDESKNTYRYNSLHLKENAKIGGEQLIKNYLESLLIYLMREDEKTIFFSDEYTIENHIVCDIIKLLEQNLYNKIDIPHLCSQMNYSKTYLCTLFKKYTNTSIMQYYAQMKIQESKKLLREREYNVTQTAELLKFNNPHYFCNVFKKHTGMSPKEYINSINK
ncbi:MAG: helix-turn-helix domain-containing protein [Lachnospiraceae bacterium]|nr:helix-turn-helix domain-containing protein [Lachnospiraceae bacterium]